MDVGRFAELPATGPAQKRFRDPMNQRVLCVWFPNWPIQRVLAAEPALARHAVVLETRDARRGLLIAAANLAARRSGARVGMRMSELAALSAASNSAVWTLRPYRPEDDLDALCDLAEQAQQFSPLVGLELHDDRPWSGRSSCEPQGLFLDISGIPHLFGGEAELLAEVARWLRQQRLFAYMSIASSVGAAWALANYEILRRSKVQRREAASSGPPSAAATAASVLAATAGQSAAMDAPADTPPTVPESRMLITESWEEAELLAGLPVSALRIDDETLQRLSRLGVRRLSDLWQLPRDGLASRLGTRLIQRSDQALGRQAEPIIALHSGPDWTLEFPLEHPTRDLGALGEVLHRLCHQLASRLRVRGHGVLRCVCRLDLVGSRPLIQQLGLFRASDDADHLHALLVGQMEQAMLAWEEGRLPDSRGATAPMSGRSGPAERAGMAEPCGAVWRVCLQATSTAEIVWEQTQLFDQGDLRQRQQLAQLIDNLSSRLGRGQVLEARVERDAEPDQAVSYRPLTGRRRDGSQQKTLRKLNSRLASSGAEPRPTDPLRRPTRLLSPPELLVGVSSPEEAPPGEFIFENRRHRVQRHWGPERLESGWWRGPSMRREYFRVETTSGDWWWLFRDVLSGAWYVHGLFG
ncbi:MAG: Y-family DNA polymerase [Aureliella sp.]